MPLISVSVSEQAPVLDGVLNETEWAGAFKIDHLYQTNGVEPAPETKIYLMRDAAWLYLGAECANPNMEHADQRYYQHDEAVSGDDSLEIFLQPAPETDYYHFLVNFAGVRAEQRFNNQALARPQLGRALTAWHANGKC